MDRNVKEINSDVENPAVEKIDRKVVERGKSVARTGTSARKPKDEHNWITDIKKIFDVLKRTIFDVHKKPYLRFQKKKKKPYLERWNSIFVASCLLAAFVDPLFFYVVNINQEHKCLGMEKTLKIVAVVMRSLTDVIFLVHLICEILDSAMDKKSGTSASGTNPPKNEPSEELEQTRENSGNKGEDIELIQYARKIAQNASLSITIDVLALLPLPQLIIIMFYPKRDSGFVEHKKYLNVFLLGQYVPRIFQIHLLAKEFKKRNGILIKGLFNLILYILAGHVLGAFWYFASIQREASCLDEACRYLPQDLHDVCKVSLYCDARGTHAKEIISEIIIHMNQSCPLDTQDDALPPFNFGIFLDSLKNESLNKTFINKLLYSFWWGLRNLSNFGTNLVTSTYGWENVFAILISIIGLVLFIYLIGNLQAFVQMKATNVEDTRQKEKATRDEDMRLQEKAIKDEEMRRQAAKIDEGCCLCMKTLKKIPMLKDMDEKVLTMMCKYLKPVTYIENSFVFRTGDPLDCMLFIIEGTMWTYASSVSHAGQGISPMAIKPLRKGDFYGEELLDWASDCFTKVPVSRKHVKSQTKVEAFLLMAKDLETVWDHFNNREQVEEVEEC